MKQIVIALFILCFLHGYSQHKKEGNFYVYADPSGSFRIKINDVLQEETHVFDVTPGVYHIEIWAPNYFVTDTTFTVTEEPCTLRVILNKTPELVEYEKLTKQHDLYHRRALMLGDAALAGLTMGTVAYIYNGQANLNRIKAKNGIDYEVSGYSLSKYESARNAYVFNQSLLYSGVAAFAGCSLYCIYTVIKKSKLKKPTIKEDKNFVLGDIGFNSTGSGLQINCSFKF